MTKIWRAKTSEVPAKSEGKSAGRVLQDLTELSVTAEADTEEESPGMETVLAQHLGLAANVLGVDLTDDKALADFLVQAKAVVTKDKAWLRSQLKRFTMGKARAAVKAAKGAI
jgi:hypothetical protein